MLETTEQRGDRLIRKGIATRLQGDLRRIMVGLRANPEQAIPAVKTHMLALGLWPPELPTKRGKNDEVEEETSEDQKLKLEEEENALRRSLVIQPEEVDACGFDLSVVVHRNFSTWADLPPKYIRMLLHVAEPIALHEQILKSQLKKGQKEVPKEVSLPIFEFVTRLPLCQKLGDRRCLRWLAAIVVSRNRQGGRPAKNLRLPVDWARHGWWRWGFKDGYFTLTRRGGAKHVVPIRLVDPSVHKPENVKLLANESESRAHLKDSNDPKWEPTLATILAAIDAMGLTHDEQQGKGEKRRAQDPVGAGSSKRGNNGASTPSGAMGGDDREQPLASSAAIDGDDGSEDCGSSGGGQIVCNHVKINLIPHSLFMCGARLTFTFPPGNGNQRSRNQCRPSFVRHSQTQRYVTVIASHIPPRPSVLQSIRARVIHCGQLCFTRKISLN